MSYKMRCIHYSCPQVTNNMFIGDLMAMRQAADLAAFPSNHERQTLQQICSPWSNCPRPIPQPPRYVLLPFPYATTRSRIPSQPCRKIPTRSALAATQWLIRGSEPQLDYISPYYICAYHISAYLSRIYLRFYAHIGDGQEFILCANFRANTGHVRIPSRAVQLGNSIALFPQTPSV